MLGRKNEFDGGKKQSDNIYLSFKRILVLLSEIFLVWKKKGNDSGNDGGGWSKWIKMQFFAI